VSRASWLAIRAPLPPRRATGVKFAAFLLPLALWALLCALYHPDVIIVEQHDGHYKPGDRVPQAQFEADKEQILALPPVFKVSEQALQAMRAAGVPEPVVANVKDLVGGNVYKDRAEFFDSLGEDFETGEGKANREVVWKHLEQVHKQPAEGKPSNPYWLPAPHQVAAAFYHSFVTPPNPGDPWMHQSLWHSCKIIFWGFLLSAVVGVPLGVLCGTFDFFSKLHEPFIDFIRYMPAPAFGALVVAIFGLYDGPKIAIIWIGTFFQMVLVVANTTRQFDESLLEAAQTLGATKRSLLTRVILPGILPNLYNDMRILIGWAWTYLIVAELIGASSGISYFINLQGRYQHFEKVYAGIIMIGLIGLAVDQVLAGLARVLFPWVPRSRGSGAWAAFFTALTFLPRWVLGRASSAKPKPLPIETS
jgi:NitT/TauT family transport system permease protein